MHQRPPQSSTLRFLGIGLVALGMSCANGADPSLPSVMTQPGDKVVTIGSTLSFNPVLSSPSAATFQWFFNGTPIQNKTNLNLTIAGCTRAHSGWYVLHAKNDAGEIATEAAFAAVQGSPAGTIQFRNNSSNRISAQEGGDAHGVSIQLFAGPAPDRLSPTGASAVVNTGLFVGGTVTIPAVGVNQIVYVRAQLSNGQLSNLFPVVSGNDFVGGTLGEMRFPVFTEWPTPMILSQPENVEINRGEDLELSVDVLDYSNVTVRWIKDGNPIPIFEEVVQLSTFGGIQGTSRLRIPSVDLDDAGSYKAVILAEYVNTVEVTASADVRIVIPRAGRIDSIELVDNWIVIGGNGRPNRNYTLERKTPDGEWNSIMSRSSSTGALNFPPFTRPTEHTWFRLRSVD